VKNRALGDTIISLGTLRYLRAILPNTQLFYFVPDWTVDLFDGTGVNDATIEGFRLQGIGDWFAMWSKMRKLQIDAILELSQGGRSALFFDMYSSVYRVPYFFHNHHSKVGVVRDQGVQKAIIQRDLDAAWTYFGWLQRCPVPNYLDFPPTFQMRDRPKIKRIILGVVATRETKMYPLEKYTELANLIRGHDFQIEIVAPLSASPEDKVIADKIAAMKAPIHTIVKPLNELPAYFKESLMYIGNDTGLKHLAVATELPTVTLFGPEPPLEWHPYDKTRHPYFFRHPLPCRYETGRTYCPLSKCASMICLKEMPPAAIWEKAKALLYETPAEEALVEPVMDEPHTQTVTRTMTHVRDLGGTAVSRARSGALKMPVELERTMVTGLTPSTPIELGDLGPAEDTSAKKPDDDPDDDDKTTIL